jgi:GNAT superfamily N-acetyltransferase
VKLRSHFDPAVSHTIEALAARAWPADEVHEADGWLLRRTEGVDRRRSNSLLPPTDPGHAARTIELALAAAEDLDVSPTIQVSPAEAHRRLDQALEDRGMPASGQSLVLAGPLTVHNDTAARPRSPRVMGASAGDSSSSVGVDHGPRGDIAEAEAEADVGGAGRAVIRTSEAPAGGDGRAIGGRWDGVTVDLSGLSADWVDAWASVSGLSGTAATAELVLSQLGERARFAVATDGAGSAIAVGIGVVEDGWLGVFSLATVPTARRHGAATAVVDALEAWALTRGARATYLQVERDNAPALTFYARRGLSIAHSYHYRSA